MCTESLNKVLNEWSKLDGAPTATNDEWCNAAQVYSNMVISQHGRDIKESIKKFIREQGGKAALRFNQATHCKEYDAQLIQNLQKAKKLLENSGFTH